MARTLAGYTDEELIGKHVYQHAGNPGKIVEVKGSYVWVQWLNGNKSPMAKLYLKDFDALIDDHEKKIATHKSNLEKLNS